MDNLKTVQGHRQFHFVYDSVRNLETMHVLGQQCDMIYHLAAAVGVQLIVDKPVHTIETNIHGTEVVLTIANTYRKKVLLASTSEFLGLAYYEQYDLPIVVTRFFNTVGPRQTGQYGMVVPRFIERALKNEPLLIYGSGKQTRCFAYVDDVIEACIGLIDTPDAPGKVYNIGSDEEITIEALADKIIQMTQSKSQKKYVSYEQAYGKPFDDMLRRVPCLDRIRQTIGYEPKNNLEQILQHVIVDIRRLPR